MDITNVVAKNVGEYLNPKFPLYRVKYVYATFDDDDCELRQHYAERIVELKPEYDDNQYGHSVFKVKSNVIHQPLVDWFQKNNEPYCGWRGDVCEMGDGMCVLGVERLA